MTRAVAPNAAVIWMMTILFLYCIVASVLPVWFLLQPRDFLSAVNLFIGLALGILGVDVATIALGFLLRIVGGAFAMPARNVATWPTRRVRPTPSTSASPPT